MLEEDLAQKKDGLACSLFQTIQQEEGMAEVTTLKEPTFVSALERLHHRPCQCGGLF